MHVVAAKAVAFGEALRPEFKRLCARRHRQRAGASERGSQERGCDRGRGRHRYPSGARSIFAPKGLTGHDADEALERAGITCNKNGIPFDPLPPVKTSGIRVGSPAGTTRGFGIAEFSSIADMIADVLDGLAAHGAEGNAAVEAAVNVRVRALCARFPIYP